MVEEAPERCFKQHIAYNLGPVQTLNFFRFASIKAFC